MVNFRLFLSFFEKIAEKPPVLKIKSECRRHPRGGPIDKIFSMNMSNAYLGKVRKFQSVRVSGSRLTER